LLVWDSGDGSSSARTASGSRHKAPVSALALSADRRRLLSVNLQACTNLKTQTFAANSAEQNSLTLDP
jgi:hypothetical protein